MRPGHRRAVDSCAVRDAMPRRRRARARPSASAPEVWSGTQHVHSFRELDATLGRDLRAGRREVCVRPLILASDDQTFETTIDEIASIGWDIRRDWRLPRARLERLRRARRLLRTRRDVRRRLGGAARRRARCGGRRAGRRRAPSRRSACATSSRSLGPVEERARQHGDVTELTLEQIELCRLLGQGLSLTDAATQLHLSRRTAFRTARRRARSHSTSRPLERQC